MKTTIEIPDSLFRRTKAFAAERGETLKEFVSQALEEKLTRMKGAEPRVVDPPWMRSFGALAHLHEENQRILALIETEFEQIDPEE